MTDEITYDARIYKTEVYKGKKVTTYYVRWRTGKKKQLWKEPFRNSAQAESFRSALVTAARKGEAFSLATGRPVTWQRDASEKARTSWYAFALDYAAVKWPYVSPNQRRSIAETLTDATEAMFAAENRPYGLAEIRHTLRTWAFSTRLRGVSEPPADCAPIARWLETATTPVADLARPGNGAARSRALLDRISKKQDGTLAAANTANRKRAVLNNAMEYAVERDIVSANPLKAVKWTQPRTLRTVDPRCVVNADQARRLLAAVAKQGPRGERLEAFFGCMYYAALRPEEVTDLRRENLTSLPDHGWGEMILTNSQPRSGSNWTDDGSVRQRRELKHRPPGETRRVPIHPDLVTLLRDHLKRFGTGPNGRVFSLLRGGIVTDRAYLAVFHAARDAAFTEQEADSLLARHPYDLRHAAVSIWLNAGAEPTRVAAWAGHSVGVLHRVYAKCVAGKETEIMCRIFDATRPAV